VSVRIKGRFRSAQVALPFRRNCGQTKVQEIVSVAGQILSGPTWHDFWSCRRLLVLAPSRETNPHLFGSKQANGISAGVRRLSGRLNLSDEFISSPSSSSWTWSSLNSEAFVAESAETLRSPARMCNKCTRIIRCTRATHEHPFLRPSVASYPYSSHTLGQINKL